MNYLRSDYIFKEILPELSQTAQEELAQICKTICMNLEIKRGKKAGLGTDSAGAIIIALMKLGYLPKNDEVAKRRRKRYEQQFIPR